MFRTDAYRLSACRSAGLPSYDILSILASLEHHTQLRRDAERRGRESDLLTEVQFARRLLHSGRELRRHVRVVRAAWILLHRNAS